MLVKSGMKISFSIFSSDLLMILPCQLQQEEKRLKKLLEEESKQQTNLEDQSLEEINICLQKTRSQFSNTRLFFVISSHILFEKNTKMKPMITGSSSNLFRICTRRAAGYALSPNFR